MNPKQTVPIIAALAPLAAAAPPLIIGGLIGGAILLLIKALLSDGKEAKPEAAAVKASTESRNEAETRAFRQVPAEIPAKPAVVPVASVPRVVVPPPAVPVVPKMSAPVPAPQKIVAQIVPDPLPIKKKLVTRDDLATVFQRGTRTLDRTDAVAALKRLGFGKTAAYSALSPDGRFSAWLQCAPDGIITWTD